MTPEQAIGAYRRGLTDSITVTRLAAPGSGGANTVASNIAARVTSYQPQELAPTIVQGDQKAIILKDDLDRQDFPVPLLKGDRILVNGKTLTIQAVDQNTRKIGTTIIAYECQVRGV